MGDAARFQDVVRGLRVAVVQEWIAARAGSEQVFEHIARALPDADLYALSREPIVQMHVGDRPIRTTFLDNAVSRRLRPATLPIMPLAWHTVSRRTYDLVISSSHAFSRWFRPARDAVHLSYVHAPIRYIWTPEIDTRGDHPIARAARAPLARLDRRSAEWTNHFAANSSEVATRIRDFYGREATVIHPPVDAERFLQAPVAGPRTGLLSFGRWISYKRHDLAIRSADMAGEPLTIAGSGPDRNRIRRLAADARIPVQIVEKPTDEEVLELFRTHRALLFPGREDFGIVPVEAAAAGLPVIALSKGGARDSVLPGATGLLVSDPSPDDFARAILASRRIPWSTSTMREHAASFAPDQFLEALRTWILRGLE